MSYFRPIDTTLGEEQVELSRKEKLKCACCVLRTRDSPRAGEARSCRREGDSRGPSLCP